jgi:hypothetical protein
MQLHIHLQLQDQLGVSYRRRGSEVGELKEP